MRVISGSARGRRLLAPGNRFGSLIRPTSDRAREALFSILSHRVDDAAVLDLFAGTGALGVEALSRGAAQAVFVDGHRQVVELITANLAACGFTVRATVVLRDLTKGVGFLAALAPSGGFDLVFVDPPYAKGLAQATLTAITASSAVLLAPNATIVVEDQANAEFPDASGLWACVDQRRYGEAGFWFYRHTETDGNE